MRGLTASLASLKESQAESYAALPRPELYKEPIKFAACYSVASVLKETEDKTSEMQEMPPITLIRCGIADFNIGKEGDLAKPTTEELFQYLEGQIPWLVSEDGLKYEVSLSCFQLRDLADLFPCSKSSGRLFLRAPSSLEHLLCLHHPPLESVLKIKNLHDGLMNLQSRRTHHHYLGLS